MDNAKNINKTKSELLAEIQALRDRLATSEATLHAIQGGEVDALVVSTPDGPRIFTLQTADQSYRLLVEEMQQGAAILSAEGLILYGNQSLANLLGRPLEKLIGAYFRQFLSLQDSLLFQSRTGVTAHKGSNTLELFLISSSAVEVPVYITISSLNVDETGMTCVVITDLTQQKRHDSERKQAEQIQEFQAVITRNMAEGICVVRADNDIIAYANRKFEQMFGYDPGELNGQHASVVNYATEAMSAEAVNQTIRRAVLDDQEATYEVHNVKKDGTPFWCSATTSIFAHPEYGVVLVAVQQDISDRKESEAKLQASLKEKELLLKEIYHRVKNNLQVIYSLLNLQSRKVSDPLALSVLRDSQSRVRAMALVHEKLYKSKDLARIDLADYIHSLAYSLLEAYRTGSQRIALRFEVEPYSLNIETALPCGLILTELMSNSLKYAFPDGRPGEIAIISSVGPDHQISLRVQDNGVGLPDNFDLQQMSSLGLSLVQNLSEQIQGTVVVSPQSAGSAFQITFPA